MIDSPFERTLYLDVDTVILRPLETLRRRAESCNVMATALDWKHYDGFEDWHPRRFPMLMSGVVFYDRAFTDIYRSYVERLRTGAGRHFKGDQYMFSMTCSLEGETLAIRREPTLQVDAMNLARHLGRDDYPRKGGVLDLAFPGLERFHIFHYNGPHKREYLAQIKERWGYPENGPPP
jgi:hypothetical protein